MKLVKAHADPTTYELYRKYCTAIHEKDKDSFDGYKNFLCLNAINYRDIPSTVDPSKVLQLGCYHMNYYLDGKLLAVGVVDFVPTGMSSVYFFYDPDYQKLSLGIIGSLKEIEYVQEMQKFFPDFKYYYLGFYIQDCQKMVYKSEYEPSELLCPITYTFCTLTHELRRQLDEGKKIRLSPDGEKVIKDMDFSVLNIEKFLKEKILFELEGVQYRLSQFNKKFQEILVPIVKTLVQLWGIKLSQSMIIADE